MPCSDTTARIVVWLDGDEKLINFDFTKLSCSKVIGVGTPLSEFCLGHHVDDILHIDFKEALAELGSDDDEENFLMYLEWDALQAALSSYAGDALQRDESQRYRVASILHSEEGVKISLIITPPSELPAQLHCCHSRK